MPNPLLPNLPSWLVVAEAYCAKATAGPWRAGRDDTISYSGDCVGPFKNVYCDDPRGGTLPSGEQLPYVVARGEGDEEECIANAQFAAAARTDLPHAIRVIRELMERPGMNNAIPLYWIKSYVDKLLELGGKLDEGSKLREAVLLRAEHAMDIVKAWKELEGVTEQSGGGDETM